jgi:hypothetical protein
MFNHEAMRGVCETTSSCLLLATVGDISPFRAIDTPHIFKAGKHVLSVLKLCINLG